MWPEVIAEEKEFKGALGTIEPVFALRGRGDINPRCRPCELSDGSILVVCRHKAAEQTQRTTYSIERLDPRAYYGNSIINSISNSNSGDSDKDERRRYLRHSIVEVNERIFASADCKLIKFWDSRYLSTRDTAQQGGTNRETPFRCLAGIRFPVRCMVSVPKAIVSDMFDEETLSKTTFFVTGGVNGNISVWRITLIDDTPPSAARVKAKIIFTIQEAHGGSVLSLCFLEDGRLVSGSDSDLTRVWKFKKLLRDCCNLNNYSQNDDNTYYLKKELCGSSPCSITQLREDPQRIVCAMKESIEVIQLFTGGTVRELECFRGRAAIELEPGVLLCLKDGELHFWFIGGEDIGPRYASDDRRIRKSSISYRLKNGKIVDHLLRLKNGNILIVTGDDVLALRYYPR